MSAMNPVFRGGSLLPAFFCSVGMFFIFLVLTDFSFGAVPGRHEYTDDREASSKTSESQEEAITALAGLPWPGVIDHLLQRPADDNGAQRSLAHINFPSIGNPRVDADIREWVESLASTFDSCLEDSGLTQLPEIDPGSNRYLQDDDLTSQLALDSASSTTYELWGSYQVSRPSENAISITFEIWNYAGNPQGNLDILTLNYNLLTGQRLGLVDIFERPEMALELMSEWARKKLGPRLGAAMRARMLRDGTEPLVENFSSLTLTPEGLRINFQPYQVAPWSTGIQKVDMPLSELMAAGPLQSLWGL